MQIIIPLSGAGQRFADAGYAGIKPLITVHGRTFISYVVSLFKQDDQFLFICNEQHLLETDLKNEITSLVPDARIVAIAPHKKGPVYAVQQAFDFLEDNEPCIVNYCDFYMLWDYDGFLKTVQESGCDGAIPCYTGFHPHLIAEENIYAGCKIGEGKKLLAIKEKYSFAKDKFKGHHSVGTYYFKSAALLKQYTTHLIETNHHLHGEFYTSMLYEQMLEDKKTILIYDAISHFCQWGTPGDFADYIWWSEVFLNPQQEISRPFPEATTLLMPMAGNGQRFVMEGYTIPKPFLAIDGLPMFLRALANLPLATKNIFISKEILPEQILPEKSEIITILTTTAGQAATCLLAKEKINNATPLLIVPCDNGMRYAIGKFLQLTKMADVLIFTFRNTNAVVRHPEQYGWVKTDADNNAIAISCKQKISETPKKDHAITGAFWFKKGSDFVQAAERMIAQNRRINKEFYVDECMNDCIAMGLHVVVFEIDKYICWGTPNDLKSYLYWQTYFKQL